MIQFETDPMKVGWLVRPIPPTTRQEGEEQIMPNIKLLRQTVLDHDIARTSRSIVDLEVLAIS